VESGCTNLRVMEIGAAHSRKTGKIHRGLPQQGWHLASNISATRIRLSY
jgi:hypothetical protein